MPKRKAADEAVKAEEAVPVKAVNAAEAIPIKAVKAEDAVPALELAHGVVGVEATERIVACAGHAAEEAEQEVGEGDEDDNVLSSWQIS